MVIADDLRGPGVTNESGVDFWELKDFICGQDEVNVRQAYTRWKTVKGPLFFIFISNYSPEFFGWNTGSTRECFLYNMMEWHVPETFYNIMYKYRGRIKSDRK